MVVTFWHSSDQDLTWSIFNMPTKQIWGKTSWQSWVTLQCLSLLNRNKDLQRDSSKILTNIIDKYWQSTSCRTLRPMNPTPDSRTLLVLTKTLRVPYSHLNSSARCFLVCSQPYWRPGFAQCQSNFYASQLATNDVLPGFGTTREEDLCDPPGAGILHLEAGQNLSTVYTILCWVNIIDALIHMQMIMTKNAW